MLTWNVYVGDFNGKKIKEHNVFAHASFMEDCKGALKKYPEKEAFLERIRRLLMYYYWSKCEWEVIITHWPPREGAEQKVDVYNQVMLNWPLFSEYVWANKDEIKKWKNKYKKEEPDAG